MRTVWGYLKRWGLPVLRQFNQAVPVLVLLGVGFLLIAIWWLGPQWTWREHQPLSELAMRVSVSVVVLVVPLLIWAWRVRNRYQRLQVERQHEAEVQVDPCLPYVEAQERALDRSLGNLLNNMERRRSLYQLPWYLVLGEENAGKTSLITRSNQSFALSHVTKAGVRAHQEEQLAYPVDWWIGDEAVLIDPPGEFLSRAGEHARNFLQDWKGKLVCDEVGGYKASFELGVTEIGCLDSSSLPSSASNSTILLSGSTVTEMMQRFGLFTVANS